MPCGEPQRYGTDFLRTHCFVIHPGRVLMWPGVFLTSGRAWGPVQAMSAMNKQMNLPALTNIMREFEKQNERMEMTSDVMGDAIDDAFEPRPCHSSSAARAIPALSWRAAAVMHLCWRVVVGPVCHDSTTLTVQMTWLCRS